MSDIKVLERYRTSNIKIIAIEVLDEVLKRTSPGIKDIILNEYIEKLLVVYDIQSIVFDNAIRDLQNALET